MKLFNKQKTDIPDIMPAKCAKTREDIDIYIERRGGRVIMTEAKRRAAKPAKGLGLIKFVADDKPIDVGEGIYPEKGYHCPVCGNGTIVRCNGCGCITCYDYSGKFTCAHCGAGGKVSGSIKSVPARSSGGGLKGDKPCYPGDKGDK